MTDETGTVTLARAYDPYGTVTSTGETTDANKKDRLSMRQPVLLLFNFA